MKNEKYLNYYIETLTSTLTDCVVRNVSMQANARISEEVIEDQQKKITELQSILNSHKESNETTISQYTNAIEKLTVEVNELRNIRNQYENVKSEAAHVETFRTELVKERELHQATRNELQSKVNNITNDFNGRINKLNSDHNDKLNSLSKDHNEKLNKTISQHKEEIKSLNERIAYLEMSPAKRKKFDLMNSKPAVNEESEELNEDGGVF